MIPAAGCQVACRSVGVHEPQTGFRIEAPDRNQRPAEVPLESLGEMFERARRDRGDQLEILAAFKGVPMRVVCLLYTSDAADE